MTDRIGGVGVISRGEAGVPKALDVRGRRVWVTDGEDGLSVASDWTAAVRPRGASGL